MKTNGADDLFLWILLLEKSYKFAINKAPSIANKLNFNAAFKKAKENLSESEEKMTISSLEIVDCLKKVDYVPKKDVYELKRTREFSLKLRKEKGLKRVLIMVRNFDLVMYLGVNKIKRKLF